MVLLHGLTATRRYVVMGSRALERDGHRVVAYDARGHGRSSPAPEPGRLRLRARWPPTCSPCSTTAASTARCWPAPRWAPTRSCASRSTTATAWRASSSSRPPSSPDDEDEARAPGALGPALGGAARRRGGGLRRGLRRAQGARAAGARRSSRCCASGSPLHEHPDALADALRAVPRSRPFESWDELAELDLPGDRGRQPRRGRPRAPVRGRRALRGGDPGRRAALRGARAPRRWPGRAASSRRSSRRSRVSRREWRATASAPSAPPRTRPRSRGRRRWRSASCRPPRCRATKQAP